MKKILRSLWQRAFPSEHERYIKKLKAPELDGRMFGYLSDIWDYPEIVEGK